MESAFVIVVVAVGIVGVLGAVLSLLCSRRTWDAIGRDRLMMDSEHDDPGTAHPPSPSSARTTYSAPGSGGADPERDAEIRQMLEARNARRHRRGEPPLDVETELQRLTAPPPAPPVDAELRAEVRDLVIARNHRRARRGEPPLDVEAEIERELSRLSG